MGSSQRVDQLVIPAGRVPSSHGTGGRQCGAADTLVAAPACVLCIAHDMEMENTSVEHHLALLLTYYSCDVRTHKHTKNKNMPATTLASIVNSYAAAPNEQQLTAIARMLDGEQTTLLQLVGYDRHHTSYCNSIYTHRKLRSKLLRSRSRARQMLIARPSQACSPRHAGSTSTSSTSPIVQVLSLAPHSVGNITQLHALVQFFSARLADWCAGVPSHLWQASPHPPHTGHPYSLHVRRSLSLPHCPTSRLALPSTTSMPSTSHRRCCEPCTFLRLLQLRDLLLYNCCLLCFRYSIGLLRVPVHQLVNAGQRWDWIVKYSTHQSPLVSS